MSSTTSIRVQTCNSIYRISRNWGRQTGIKIEVLEQTRYFSFNNMVRNRTEGDVRHDTKHQADDLVLEICGTAYDEMQGKECVQALYIYFASPARKVSNDFIHGWQKLNDDIISEILEDNMALVWPIVAGTCTFMQVSASIGHIKEGQVTQKKSFKSGNVERYCKIQSYTKRTTENGKMIVKELPNVVAMVACTHLELSCVIFVALPIYQWKRDSSLCISTTKPCPVYRFGCHRNPISIIMDGPKSELQIFIWDNDKTNKNKVFVL